MNKHLMRTRFTQILLAAALASSGHSAVALDSLALELGRVEGSQDVNRYGAVATWDWGVKWWQIGDWSLGGYWEAGVDYWDGKKGRTGNDSLVDFHVTPVFRYQYTGASAVTPFAEIGVGAHGFTDDKIGNKDFDIPFAFGSHFGAGFRFGEKKQYEVLYRFQHLSNAGLGDKNPGINFHLIHLGYHF